MNYNDSRLNNGIMLSLHRHSVKDVLVIWHSAEHIFCRMKQGKVFVPHLVTILISKRWSNQVLRSRASLNQRYWSGSQPLTQFTHYFLQNLSLLNSCPSVSFEVGTYPQPQTVFGDFLERTLRKGSNFFFNSCTIALIILQLYFIFGFWINWKFYFQHLFQWKVVF